MENAKKLELLSQMLPYVERKVWGGQMLAGHGSDLKLADNQEDPIGELWEVSQVPGKYSSIKSGTSKVSMQEYVANYQIPYLIKFIDTAGNLSIQVHPGDEYAEKFENSKGKTECWFIIDHKAGAGIYLGFKPNVDIDQFKNAVSQGLDVTQFLVFYPVKKGDFFYIPAGTIHAIGADILLAEIQQSSGITYRVWDWNRLDQNGKGRELHLKKALDVLNFSNASNTSKYFKILNDLFNNPKGDLVLIESKDFSVSLIKLKAGEKKLIKKLHQSSLQMISIVCILGKVDVEYNSQVGQVEFLRTLLINPSQIGDIKLLSSCNTDSFVLWVE